MIDNIIDCYNTDTMMMLRLSPFCYFKFSLCKEVISICSTKHNCKFTSQHFRLFREWISSTVWSIMLIICSAFFLSNCDRDSKSLIQVNYTSLSQRDQWLSLTSFMVAVTLLNLCDTMYDVKWFLGSRFFDNYVGNPFCIFHWIGNVLVREY